MTEKEQHHWACDLTTGICSPKETKSRDSEAAPVIQMLDIGKQVEKGEKEDEN